MIEMFCHIGKKIAIIAAIFGVLTYTFVSLGSAVLFASAAVGIFGLAVIFFSEDSADKNTKTAIVAQIFVAATALFTVALALVGARAFAVAIPIAMTGALAYIAARIAQNKNNLPIGLLFITVLPLGFLFVEALKLMYPYKKEG